MKSWYAFDSEGRGHQRIKEYLVAFYERGKCYDEAHFVPDQVAKVMSYLMTPGAKVFAVFSKEEVYEIKLHEVIK